MKEDKEMENNSKLTDETAEFNVNADESAAGTNHLNEPVAEENELEKLQAELAELKDKFVRQAAEFQNYRTRTAKEKYELIQTAGKDVIISLLEVLDDFDRAETQMKDAPDTVKEGFLLIFNKLRNNLQSRGLKAMECINTEFDVEKHEAVAEIPAPSEDLKGKVIDDLQKGYFLNDKIIRHAKVVVGK